MLVANAGSDISAFGRERSFAALPAELAGATDHAKQITPRPVEPTQGTRFVYDRETKRSFVEFLDRDSGRVILRFPAEQQLTNVLQDNLAHASASGNLIDIHA